MLERPPGQLRKPDPRRELAHRRELSRQRNRRLRARRKARQITVTIELGENEINWLVRIGWLGEDDGDRRLIGKKISAGIAVSAAVSSTVPAKR
jgi:hypothetical protein